MSKEQAISKLIELQNNGDTEAAHCEADQVLCDFLRAIGHGDVADEWEKVDKWYA